MTLSIYSNFLVRSSELPLTIHTFDVSSPFQPFGLTRRKLGQQATPFQCSPPLAHNECYQADYRCAYCVKSGRVRAENWINGSARQERAKMTLRSLAGEWLLLDFNHISGSHPVVVRPVRCKLVIYNNAQNWIYNFISETP
jgi:hypothetical protein